jgi:beta-glucosidase
LPLTDHLAGDRERPPVDPSAQWSPPLREGLFVGYRGCDCDGQASLYRFGQGLGLSTWKYVSINAPRQSASGAGRAVAIGLRNVGPRRGREAVQLDAGRPDSRIERPIRWLVGFAPVDADAYEAVTATITFHRRAFEHWNVDAGRCAVGPGIFRLAARPPSAVLPISTDVAILPERRRSSERS